MVDYEFEEKLEMDESIDNFYESRNWGSFTYEQNEMFLDDCRHLSYFHRLNLNYLLSLSKDYYLHKKGYYMHPLRVKRSKFQKIKKNKV